MTESPPRAVVVDRSVVRTALRCTWRVLVSASRTAGRIRFMLATAVGLVVVAVGSAVLLAVSAVVGPDLHVDPDTDVEDVTWEGDAVVARVRLDPDDRALTASVGSLEVVMVPVDIDDFCAARPGDHVLVRGVVKQRMFWEDVVVARSSVRMADRSQCLAPPSPRRGRIDR